MILDIDGVLRSPIMACKTSNAPPKLESLLVNAEERSHFGLSAKELDHLIQDYLFDCKYRLNTESTIATRRIFLKNFLWFLDDRGFARVEKQQIKQFMLYLHEGHLEERGRWGNKWLKRPMRPVSIKDYYVVLKLFFDWLVREEAIDISPMSTLLAPVVHTERVQPFTNQQIIALVKAAKESVQPLRNEAIIWFLFDTGVRASELCNLRMKALDLDEQRCVVLGKGNKQRHIYFGGNTKRALRHYLRKRRFQSDSLVFLGERGTTIEKGLTRSGLLHMIVQLGRAAGIQSVRCSPHTFRHTFAIEFLRAGGNQFSLKELLGHTTLHMTNKYVALAQADIQAQHQKYSPGDRLMFGTSKAW